MIILDYNQVAIANLMTSNLAKNTNSDISQENLLRHMILNSIRMNKVKFEKEYGDLVIACDSKNYWRKDIFPYYKAARKRNRQESSLDWNEIFRILNKIRDELLEYFPYPVLNIETAEADDVIATLCHEHGKELGGNPILILSGDKDFMQLQKYSNVSQYDPIRKKWIKTNSPCKFLLEHILRGDVSDGIPNVLTEDDCFAIGARQRQLRSKYIDKVINEGTEVMSTDALINFQRNKKLIDLDLIPLNLQKTILVEYDKQSSKTRSKLFNYFIKHKLKNLTESIGEF